MFPAAQEKGLNTTAGEFREFCEILHLFARSKIQIHMNMTPKLS